MSEEDLVLVRSRQTSCEHGRSAGPWKSQGGDCWHPESRGETDSYWSGGDCGLVKDPLCVWRFWAEDYCQSLSAHTSHLGPLGAEQEATAVPSMDREELGPPGHVHCPEPGCCICR